MTAERPDVTIVSNEEAPEAISRNSAQSRIATLVIPLKGRLAAGPQSATTPISGKDRSSRKPIRTELPVRKLSVKVMDMLASSGKLEADWQKKPQLHLDFSDKTFFLETIKPIDFCWGGRLDKSGAGLDEASMPVYKLKTLNLDDNELKDDDCEPWTQKPICHGLSGVVFRNLQVLRLKRNKLKYPILAMPRLRELHLSHNNIVRVPPLAGLKGLEVLVLSHNHIKTIEDHQFDDVTKLKRLQMNDNRIDIEPSGLHKMLCKIQTTARELENLQLRGNPFCAYFNEYQIFVVWFLSSLKRLDDLDLTKAPGTLAQMRQEARKVGMGGRPEGISAEFDRLDAQVQRARAAVGQQIPRNAARPTVLPKIDTLISELDAVLRDSSNLKTCVSLLYENASVLTKDNMKENMENHLFDSTETRSTSESHAATFVQQVCLLAERFPESRALLLRTLAKFCPVESYHFGELCMAALVTFAKGSDDQMREVRHVVAESLIPFIGEKADRNPIGDASWETVVVGLSKFNCPELGEMMSPDVVPHLGTWYTYVVAREAYQSSKLRSALIQLLKCAVQTQGGASKVIEEVFLKEVSMSLSGSVDLSTDKYEFVDCLGLGGIMEGCIKHCRERVIPILVQQDFHSKLLKRIRALVEQRAKFEVSEACLLVVSKKVSMAIDLMLCMMQDPMQLEKFVFWDINNDLPMIRCLVRAPREESPDPLELASSLSCLQLLLRNRFAREKYLDFVAKSLSLREDPNRVLPNITAKRFQEMYRLCEKHTNLRNDEAASAHDLSEKQHLSARGSILTAAHDFSNAVDLFSHRAIVSVVEFVKVFPELSEECPICKEVSQMMNAQGRDTMLFKLLRIPSTDVREAVVKFVENATSELDEGEQKQLVDMIDSTNVGQDNLLLKALLQAMQRLLTATGELGDTFRSKYARMVLEKTYQVLVKNAERHTYGNHFEEERKLMLSRQAVALLACASDDPFLRKVRCSSDADQELLTCDDIGAHFRRVIKLEETLHGQSKPDVCLELTWTGRQIKTLMGFLNPSSGDALLSSKKQGFRIFNRIANIIAGKSDYSDHADEPPALTARLPESARESAKEEARMWSLEQMRSNIYKLDDASYLDRLNQQEYFFSFKGLDQMLHFLEFGLSNEATKARSVPQNHWDSLVSQLGRTDRQTAVLGNAIAHRLPMIRVAEMQGLAKEHLIELQDYAHNLETQHAEAAMKRSLQEELGRVVLPGQEEETPIDAENLFVRAFMEEGWKAPDTRASIQSSSTSLVPASLRALPGEVFLDACGHVGLHYYVASLLRTVYALLVVPMNEGLKEAMIGQLHHISLLTRLLALVEQCGSYISCNVCAKFLRITSIALQMPAHDFKFQDHGSLASGLHNGLFVTVTLACRCVNMIAPLLENVGQAFSLTKEQHILVQEAMRLLGSASHTAMAIQFSEKQEIQRECMALVFQYMLPLGVARAIFMCFLYDVQASIGSIHGSSINRHFVDSMLERQELYELSAEVLSIMVRSSHESHYDILDLVHQFKVLKKQTIHKSFTRELMDCADVHDYCVAMQQMLDEQLSGEMEAAVPFFMGDWEGKRSDRNDASDSVGIAFVANADFHITALGRPTASAQRSAARVTLWSSFPKRTLASVEVGPGSIPEGCYSYRELEAPVRISYGKEYRLVQEYRERTDAPFFNGFISPTDAHALAATSYAVFHGGVSGPSLDYPLHFDGDFRRAGMVNFKIAQKERILQCINVELRQCGGSSYMGWAGATGTRRMVLTNKRLLITEAPPAIKFQLQTQAQSKPTGIERDIPLADLTRIVCGMDTQMFIMGFLARSLITGVSEQFVCVICHKSSVRSRLLELLRELTGPSLQARVHPSCATLVDQAIRRWTSSAIICISYAFNGDRLSLFILTHTEFCEFEVHFENWIPSNAEVPYTGDGDNTPFASGQDDAKLLRRWKAETQGHVPSGKFTGSIEKLLEERRKAVEATQAFHYKVSEERLEQVGLEPNTKLLAEQEEMFKQVQQRTLRQVRKAELPCLTEVEFDSGELPVLRLTFQKFAGAKDPGTERFTIRFLDDVARERWRRGLAVALRGTFDHATHWNRSWADGTQNVTGKK